MASNSNKIVIIKRNKSSRTKHLKSIPLGQLSSQSLGNFSNRTNLENGLVVQSVPNFSRNRFTNRRSRVSFVNKNPIPIIAFKPIDKTYEVNSLRKSYNPFDFNDQYVVLTTSFQDFIQVPVVEKSVVVQNVI